MRWPTAGHVSDLSFARLFGGLAADRATGVLHLEQDTRAYAICLNMGEIVDARSSAPEDTFGRIALEAGLIDSAAVGESIRRMAREKNKGQRELLIEQGALKAEDADRVARLSLTRRALRVFGLAQAGYRFEDQEPGADPAGPIEPRWVLYRGLRQAYDEARLDRELAELTGKAFRLPGDSGEALAAYGFADEERIVAGYLQKGYWELSDLVEACLTLPRQGVLAVVLSLLAFDALDVQPSSSVPRLRKRVRETTVRLSRDNLPPGAAPMVQQQIRPPGSAPIAPPTRPPIGAAASPSPRPMTVPPSSSPLPARTQTLPPVGAKPPTVPPGKPISQPLAPVASKAPTPPGGSQSASHGAINSENIANTIRDKVAVKLSQLEGGADHFVLLEVGRGAGSSEIKSAYISMAKLYHPDRLALVKLEELRPQVERIFARLSDAHATLSDDGRRQEYLKILSQGGEAAVKRREDDETARATRVLTAEEHFRKGEMALRREQYLQAVHEFEAAVEMNELEAEHHALLAWARWCNASDKEAAFAEVKKGLAKALELNSSCVPALFYYGEVYLARGEHDRAYNMFQRVLGTEENHVMAQRQVRLIEMRRAKNEKKGLFDRFRKK